MTNIILVVYFVVTWAPHSSCHICTGGDDNTALIWDLTVQPPILEPILSYKADSQVNYVSWGTQQPEWVAVGFHKQIQILRV